MEHYHDYEYMELVRDIMLHGVRKENRTGVDTFAVFSRQMRFKLDTGSIPLLTTKKMHTRSIIYEILWYLQGGDNVKYLNDNGVTIWNEWTDKNGYLGPIYGYQWRKWPTYDMIDYVDGKSIYREGPSVDQIAEVINKLRTNPNDRRLLVSAWNVGELNEMALPPCHYTFQFYTRPLKRAERISLESEGQGKFDATHEELDRWGCPRYALSCMMNQRSCDTGLGVPFNIVQYSILTHMVAHVVNMVPEEFIWNGGDVHIYENHVEQLKEQLERVPYPSPKLKLNPDVKEIDDFKYEDFEIIDYNHHPLLRMEVAV